MATGIAKIATVAEKDALTAVLVLAFSTDPAARWMYRDPHQYITHFPSFVQAFAGNAYTHQSAYYVGEYAGAALWLPPDVHPDEEAMIDLMQRTVPERYRQDASAVFEQMGRYHPRQPHWYLPLIGVDPAHQGHGYGSTLMQHALVPCDQDKTPAYLESSNPRNISLYKRHGFELLGTIQAGTSPPLYPMLRPPR
jgi:ribosomal protein S18 acetylase RimI-like enzyme